MYCIPSAEYGQRERARIRREREEARFLAEETIAEAEEVLREVNEVLARVVWALGAGPPLYGDSAPIRLDNPRRYWLYAFDKERHLIGPPVAIRAHDDEAAIAHADSHVDGRLDAELMDGDRLVKRIPRSRCLVPGAGGYRR
jgi:hypothetical protein